MTDSKEDDADRNPAREWIKARVVGAYDAALLAGSPQRRYFEKLGFPSDRIFLGYDVVDNDYFRTMAGKARASRSETSRKLGIAAERPFFLASSRFIHRKNLECLLLAYDDYQKQTGEAWDLVLLGDGPLRERLEQLIGDREIANVHMPGFVQIDAVPKYYGLAGAFVHPARKDQWALVVNEAMASGLPVLVSSGAGCAEDLIREGVNGFVFDPGDRAGLASMMARVSSAEIDIDAFGNASRRIISDWTLDRFAEALWQAVECGARYADRPLAPMTFGLLRAMHYMSRSMSSFHAIEA